MRRPFRARILAASLLLGTASFALSYTPAAADSVSVSVSFQTFHDQLSGYGDWVYSDRWGEVWIPADVSSDFHPYGTRGHWAYTDEYGWLWVSDYEWGDIAFHYGRWVNDPDDGWLWIPGYVWSPGWVVWRSNGQYTGWMPMPPDDNFMRGGNNSAGISFGGGGLGFSINFNNTNDYYGYSRWYGRSYNEDRFASNWVFIGTRHMGDRDFRRYEAPRSNYRTIVRNTTNITNYTIVNNYVVNRSVDVHVVERASGRTIRPVHANEVIRRPQFISRADTGRDIETRARAERPRGNGDSNSAPKPQQQVIDTLSTRIRAHGGKQPAHLFTRDTVKNAPLPEKPAPTPGNANGPAHAPGEMPNSNSGAPNPVTGMPNGNPGEPNHGATMREKMRQHGNENVPAGTATPPPVMPETNKLVPGNQTSKPDTSTDHGAGDMSPMHPPATAPSTTTEPGANRNRHPGRIIPPPITPPDNSNAGGHREQMPKNVETPRVPREPKPPVVKPVEPVTPPAVEKAVEPAPPATTGNRRGHSGADENATPDTTGKHPGKHDKKPKGDEPGAQP